MIDLDTWLSVQQVQARAMPRCHNHPDRAAWVICDERTLCADCVATLVEARSSHEQKLPG